MQKQFNGGSIDSFFNNGACSNHTSIGKTVNLNINLTSYTKMNAKWIMDLNIKCKTIKLLDFKHMRKSSGQWAKKGFLDQTPKHN